MKKIYNLLKKLNIKLRYLKIEELEEEILELPYLIYQEDFKGSVFADDEQINIIEFSLMLFTKRKDLKTEKEIEKLLNDNDLIFEKKQEYLLEEQVFQTIYNFQKIEEREE